MPNERLSNAFSKNNVQRGAFLPYLSTGFPDLETTEALIHHADTLKAAVVELGFPFSDSIADGPVIQNSFHYALERQITVERIFEMVARVRPRVECGLVAMVSFSIVYRIGVDAFLNRASKVGFDGVIVPDVPAGEGDGLAERAVKAGLCHIGLVAPSTTPERAQEIAATSTGFIYRIAISGTTGERASLPASLPDEVATLRKLSGLPVCVGFGISTPAHVREVCRFADGAIVGSAIVRCISDSLRRGESGNDLLDRVRTFMTDLASGVNDLG